MANPKTTGSYGRAHITAVTCVSASRLANSEWRWLRHRIVFAGHDDLDLRLLVHVPWLLRFKVEARNSELLRKRIDNWLTDLLPLYDGYVSHWLFFPGFILRLASAC